MNFYASRAGLYFLSSDTKAKKIVLGENVETTGKDNINLQVPLVNVGEDIVNYKEFENSYTVTVEPIPDENSFVFGAIPAKTTPTDANVSADVNVTPNVASNNTNDANAVSTSAGVASSATEKEIRENNQKIIGSLKDLNKNTFDKELEDIKRVIKGRLKPFADQLTYEKAKKMGATDVAKLINYANSGEKTEINPEENTPANQEEDQESENKLVGLINVVNRN